MTTHPDTTPLEVRQAYVVARVRRGASVADAAREVHISPKSIQHWRERTPGFAERLNQARRDARAMARRTQQERFFELVRCGRSVAEALDEMGLGPGQAWAWLRYTRDRWYAHEYRRLIGPTGKSGKSFACFITEIKFGASIPVAARVAGWTPSAVYQWRLTRPDLWDQVVKARIDGRGTT